MAKKQQFEVGDRVRFTGKDMSTYKTGDKWARDWARECDLNTEDVYTVESVSDNGNLTLEDADLYILDSRVFRKVEAETKKEVELDERLIEHVKKAVNHISKAFNWEKSPQGHEYWDEVCENMCKIAGLDFTEVAIKNFEKSFDELMGELLKDD